MINIKNKKIAVGFFGISYKENYSHWMGWKTNPDWRKTNYKQSLRKLLIDSNNVVDHYFSTYHHVFETELIEDLKPIGYRFNEFTDNSWVYSRHCRFKEVLDLFPNDYDYYIVTRFDLSFSVDNLSRCSVHENSINVTSKHGYGTDTELSCDYFYILDNSMLEPFKLFLETLPPDNGDLCYYHKLHRYPGCPKISYMIDGTYYSHNCPVWTITR